MNKIILEKEAKKFPLLREYDFLPIRNRCVGASLLVPTEEGYMSKEYGIGRAVLINYLQPYFNKEERIRIDELIIVLRKNKEVSLARVEPGESIPPFLLSTVNLFLEDRIIKKEGDLLLKGDAYDEARVHKIPICKLRRRMYFFRSG